MYAREVNFYLRLADDVPIRTPDVYCLELQGESRLVLLMEDLGDWSCPTLAQGASESQIELAVTQLARLTAAFWNSPRLEAESSWLPDWDVDYMRIADQYRACLPEFLRRFGKILPAGSSNAAEAMLGKFDELAIALNTGTRVSIWHVLSVPAFLSKRVVSSAMTILICTMPPCGPRANTTIRGRLSTGISR